MKLKFKTHLVNYLYVKNCFECPFTRNLDEDAAEAFRCVYYDLIIGTQKEGLKKPKFCFVEIIMIKEKK